MFVESLGNHVCIAADEPAAPEDLELLSVCGRAAWFRPAGIEAMMPHESATGSYTAAELTVTEPTMPPAR